MFHIIEAVFLRDFRFQISYKLSYFTELFFAFLLIFFLFFLSNSFNFAEESMYSKFKGDFFLYSITGFSIVNVMGQCYGSEKSSVENMFDGFGSSNLDLIDVDGLKRFSDVNVSTERKATTILVNQTVTGSGNSKSVSSGGVNSSNLSSMFMMNKDDKTMDQIQSIILNL